MCKIPVSKSVQPAKKPVTPFGIAGFFLLYGYELNYLPFQVMSPDRCFLFFIEKTKPL